MLSKSPYVLEHVLEIHFVLNNIPSISYPCGKGYAKSVVVAHTCNPST